LGLVFTITAPLIFCICTGCEDKGTSQGAKSNYPDNRCVDDYVGALAAANEFCHAWLTGSLQDARALMTRRLIRQHPDERIADAVVGVSNPLHVAYEIFQGRKLAPKGFAFNVRFFRKHFGQQGSHVEGPVERIVMVRDEKGRWLVDEFPLLR
jgi:hypothetical protein